MSKLKIDLHCHTRKVKKGDAKTREVTPDLFEKKIADADVNIVAITNHNLFDIEQYNILKNRVADFCQVWPGIELDIVDESNLRWHLIIVVNPKNVNDFYKKTQQLLAGKDKDSVSLDVKKAVSSFEKFDVIFIPHYHKEPEIPKKDLEKLYSLVNEEYRIFLETSNYRSLGVFANYQYKVLIGSDVKDWNKYEKSNFAELRLGIESFEQFLMLAKRDVVNVNTLLNSNTALKVWASPHRGIRFQLELFPEMNIIFGQKGTGKSEILSSLRDSLQTQGKICSMYKGTDRDDDFKKIMSTAGMLHRMQELNVGDGKEDIAYILGWKDTSPTIFSEYLVWADTREKNKNKRLMKITNATKIPKISSKSYMDSKSDRDNARKVAELVNIISCEKYLSTEEIEQLYELLNKLCQKSQNKMVDTFIEKEAVDLANYSIEKIKAHADKHSNTKSFPSTTGFLEYAMLRVNLRNSVKRLLKAFNVEPRCDMKYLGNLEGKGPVFVTSIYRMLRKGESKTAEFSYGIKQLEAVYDALVEIDKSIFDVSLQTNIDKFRELCTEFGISSLDPFVGTRKVITNELKEEYTPSNGEKGILLLQRELDSEADAYLIDEPELGMGNSYIDNCIRPKLSELAKRKKIVVVATHNANIAVRTLPYQSIFRQYKNGIYKTYAGNPFTNLLVNIDDESDVLIWKEESMHTLEGGQEAFYEREHIYDAGSHQC